MTLPGFSAEASLSPARWYYVGAAGNAPGGGEVVPSQSFATAGCIAACVLFYLEGGAKIGPPRPTAFQEALNACAPVCGAVLTPSLTLQVLAFSVSALGVGEVAAGGGAVMVGEEAAAAAGLGGGFAANSLAALLGAAGFGLALGSGVGLGIQALITPPLETGLTPRRGCQTTVRFNAQGTLSGDCQFGKQNSLNRAVNLAERTCQGLGPNYCAGQCPDGRPCSPTAIAVPRDQSLCVYEFGPFGILGTETIVEYECVCGC